MILILISLSFKSYDLPEHERIVYIGFDKGTKRDIIREVIETDSSYIGIQHHLDETDLTTKGEVSKLDLSTIKVYKRTNGKEAYYLLKDGKHYVYRVKGGKWRRIRKYPIYDRHTLFEVFRFYPFGAKDTIRFPMFEGSHNLVVKALCRYDGIHRVKTPMGEFECYRLVLDFDTGLLGSIAKLLLRGRRFEFYYEKKYPHRLIYWTDNKDGYIMIKRIEK